MASVIQTKEIVEIPLDMIDENPDNEAIFNMDDIDRLAENIEKEAFHGSVELYLKKDGRYEISSGHRRIRAMQLLGRKTVPATVYPEPDLVTEKRRKLISSNINNRNMNPMDWARAIQYHIDTLIMEDAQKYGKSIDAKKRYKAETNLLNDAASYFGFNYVTITRYRKLNKLIPSLQKLIEDKTIPWTSICVAGDFDDKLQNDLYALIMHTLSFSRPVPNEEGKETVSLSGAQVSRLIQEIKDSQERGRSIPKTVITNTSTNEVKSVEPPHNEVKGVNKGVYEQENVSKKVNEYVSHTDEQVSAILNVLVRIDTNKILIREPETVKEQIEKIEDILSVIKHKCIEEGCD